jgi:hypothetical protein
MNLSNSATVIYILEKTLCLLKKYQFNMNENKENLSYQSVKWNNNIHLLMDKSLYRKIKHLSDSVFAFSMAIIIRKLIEMYFKILEKSNNKIERVERIFKRFHLVYTEMYEKNTKNEQLYGDFYYQLTFNCNFNIVGINFIHYNLL